MLACIVVATVSVACRPVPPPASNGSSCYGTPAEAVIRDAFAAYDIPQHEDKAQHVAYRESRCMGSDTNPTGVRCGGSISHARGLFQILIPCHQQAIWENCPNPYGASTEQLADDPVCNARTTAAMVRSGGWGPWGG